MRFGLGSKRSDDSARGQRSQGVFPAIRIRVWGYRDLHRVKEVRSYTVDYSRIVIGDLIDAPRKVYLVLDPPVSGVELRRLEEIAGELVYVVEEIPDEKGLVSMLRERGVVRPELQYLIVRELAKDRFGPLDPLMNDPSLENIECTGPGKPVTVTHNEFGRLETNLVFEEEELDKLVMKLANKAGKSVSKANPKIDNARLPGGHRLACTFMSEISESSSFVIRKFPSEPWTVTKQMLRGTLTPEIGAWLWLLIEHKLPVLVVGGMGTGKTSLANALCGFIPPDKRVGTVEDVPEFNLPVKKQNWQRMFTRESYTLDGRGSIDLFQLVKEMLRYQVEYLIVNEIRGEEARVWFQQVSSGHGGITTIHADDFESALARLKDLGIDIASLSGLHGLVYIGVYTVGGKRARRIREVADFSIEEGRPKIRHVFVYDPASDSYKCMPPEEMAKLRSARKIMSFSERIRSEEDFVREYELRRRYLEWLRSMAAADPRYLKPEFLVVEFEKFYANPRYFESITPPEVPRPKVEATSTGAAFADSSVKLVRWGKRELGSTVRVIDVRKGAGEGTVAIVERKAKKKKGGRKDRKLLRLRRE
ncbi:MAG: type II/IV secretion system ATPase subunit [Thermofilum sp.]|nr:type II/IV secretion system ATPase subunit [Thermofilum sp.]